MFKRKEDKATKSALVANRAARKDDMKLSKEDFGQISGGEKIIGLVPSYGSVDKSAVRRLAMAGLDATYRQYEDDWYLVVDSGYDASNPVHVKAVDVAKNRCATAMDRTK